VPQRHRRRGDGEGQAGHGRHVSPRAWRRPAGDARWTPRTRVRHTRWPWAVTAALILLIVVGVATEGPRPAAGPRTTLTYVSPPTTSGPPTAPDGVVYDVSGDGRARTITYSATGTGDPAHRTDAGLPFRAHVPDTGGPATWELTAQRGPGQGTISCRITRDGLVVAEEHSDGPLAVVTCDGS
jgi:hypothetical protein